MTEVIEAEIQIPAGKQLDVHVMQWSFCSIYKGVGCKGCMKKGVVMQLIPLNSLKAGMRDEYAKLQKDPIQRQIDEYKQR